MGNNEPPSSLAIPGAEQGRAVSLKLTLTRSLCNSGHLSPSPERGKSIHLKLCSTKRCPLLKHNVLFCFLELYGGNYLRNLFGNHNIYLVGFVDTIIEDLSRKEVDKLISSEGKIWWHPCVVEKRHCHFYHSFYEQCICGVDLPF